MDKIESTNNATLNNEQVFDKGDLLVPDERQGPTKPLVRRKKKKSHSNKAVKFAPENKGISWQTS